MPAQGRRQQYISYWGIKEEHMLVNFFSSGGGSGGGGGATPVTFLPPPPPVSQNFSMRIVERKTLSAGDITAKYIDLANRPIDPLDIQFTPEGFTDYFYTYDYLVTHNGSDYRRVTWAGKPPELGLSAGTPVKFVYDSDLSIGADGKIVKYYPVDANIVAAKNITLPIAPQDPTEVEFNMKGFPDSVLNQDYTVAGLTLSWAGLPPDGVIAPGDVLRVVYYANTSLAVSDYAMETVNLNGTHILNKYVDLTFLPTDPSVLEVSLEGFPDSTVGTDYEIISDGFSNKRLSWNGKNLELIVAAGLDLKINYNY
jgi:hypothetical protein